MGLGENGMAATMEADSAAPKARDKAAGGKASDKAIEMDRKDSGSDELVAGATEAAMSGAMAEAVKAAAAASADDSKTVRARRFTVVTDESRDALLTDFGKDTLTDRKSVV